MKKLLMILAVLCTLVALAPVAMAQDAPEGQLDPFELEAPAAAGEEIAGEEITIDEQGLPTLAFADGPELAFLSNSTCTDACDHHYDLCIEQCPISLGYACRRACFVEVIQCYSDCG